MGRRSEVAYLQAMSITIPYGRQRDGRRSRPNVLVDENITKGPACRYKGFKLWILFHHEANLELNEYSFRALEVIITPVLQIC